MRLLQIFRIKFDEMIMVKHNLMGTELHRKSSLSRIYERLLLMVSGYIILSPLFGRCIERLCLRGIYGCYLQNNPRVDIILNRKLDTHLLTKLGERNLPGEERFKRNAWWKTMLLRYGLAMHFSKNREVLDTCSGLGWGTYLLDDVASSVKSIELDNESITIAKELWKTNNTEYINASVIRIPCPAESYDVVTAMESVEHFKVDEIKLYLKEIYRVLKPSGFLIGSSAFPENRKEADLVCAENKYHLHICTRSEIYALLKIQGFRKVRIFSNRIFFVAMK